MFGGELASAVHAKACAHARSVGAIAHSSSMFDHSAIMALARMLMESLTMFVYLKQQVSGPEWDLRHLVLRLHDAVSRIKLLRAWQEGPEYADLTEGRCELEAEVQQNEVWLRLPEEQRRKLLEGEVIFVGGMRRAAETAGWDGKVFLAIYNYLSAHLHGAPMSFFRMRDHKIDYYSPSDHQTRMAQLSIQIASACLRRISVRRLSELRWQDEPLLAATSEKIQREDASCEIFGQSYATR